MTIPTGLPVGDLDFANDRTAYMMECPNLVFWRPTRSPYTALKA